MGQCAEAAVVIITHPRNWRRLADWHASQRALPGRLGTRYGTSEEIAATVAFLISEAAAYITGQSIRVDRGLTGSV
jgi:NAD(P)-dependent dehydrogenase (short-subunit alcohol dehydrogenase family)